MMKGGERREDRASPAGLLQRADHEALLVERRCGGRSGSPTSRNWGRPFLRSLLRDKGSWKAPLELVKFPMEVSVLRAEDCGMAALGTNLREARERLGLTQEQVAQRSGVHATEVSRIEAGKRDPQVSTLERLAKAVEMKPGRLLD